MAVVTDIHVPSLVVDHSVVMATQQDGIVQAGLAALGPVFDVMSVCPSRWAPASWESAATVPGQQRFTNRRRYSAVLTPDIKRYAFAVENHRRQRGITGQHAGRFTTDPSHPLQPERTRITLLVQKGGVLSSTDP